MKTRSAPICAAIDVGSNTIHIVVARCFPRTLEIIADELETARIGESVTATGAISPEKCQVAIDTLQKYQVLARQHGAKRVFVVATEAIRQASNSAEFVAQVREQTGLEIQLISGAAEAALTFFGATYEAGEHEQVGVIDLGGGSLELAFARKMRLTWRTSLPIGSGWLHDRYLPGDPPTADEVEAAEAFLHTYFRGVSIKQRAPTLIVTGGSANSLHYLVQEAFHRSPEPRRLSLNDLARCQGLLSALETGDIVKLYKQPPARARILLAGTLIIAYVMRRLQVQEILVSPHGIREGVLLAYARYGEQWLAEVEKAQVVEETFAQTARAVLLERLHTMLEWPAEVLKHEDSEAVHKMRVASRRLRAALDAYQSCCEPKSFKRIYRKVKKVADALGEARDTDVMLHHLYEQLESLSEEEQEGVRWLIERLHTYREQKQQELIVVLRRLDGKKLEDQLKASVREGMGK